MYRREFIKTVLGSGVALSLESLSSNCRADIDVSSAGIAPDKILPSNRNVNVIKQIESAEVKYPYTFVFGGDCGATANPTGDGIFSQILTQMEQLEPKPKFFVNIGDFSGPGTLERHKSYLNLISKSTIPILHVIGNHDVDDNQGWKNFHDIYGPENFSFAFGNTLFVAINSQMSTGGPRTEDLIFLEKAFKRTPYPVRILLMHMPPNLNKHYTPVPEWGFTKNEKEFLNIVKANKIKMICCAHVIAYDYYVYDNIPYVVSGGLGWGLHDGFGYLWGTPPHRGAFYHFVAVTVSKDGEISGRIIRAFDSVNSYTPFEFKI